MFGKVNIGAKGTAYNKGYTPPLGRAKCLPAWLFSVRNRSECCGQANHKNGRAGYRVTYLYRVIRSV